MENYEILLKNGADPNLGIEDDGEPILMSIAAISESDEMVIALLKLLLKYGANINATDNSGNNALAIYDMGENLAKFLIENKINVNNVDNDGDTPLHTLEFQSYFYVKLLIDNGANVNAKNHSLITPLMYATHSKITPVEKIKLLLQSEANINDVNDEGDSALHYAAHKGTFEVMNELIKNGANVHAKNNKGYPPLMYTVDSIIEPLEKTKLLLQNKANIEESDNQEFTALHHATRHGSLEVIKELIKNGANVNAKSKTGRTPLMMAVISQEIILGKVLLLLENGANVNDVNNDNVNAIELARANNANPIVIQLLKKYMK